ncbi:MAG: ABC transporter ATP-binding protein [Oscillospiraceae bacterium]|nr:ABC transporter ATP-binding protein [Oscillospiraceae bacterium]
MEENLIRCTGLTKKYGSFAALRNLNLTVGRGRIIGLLGPNGSGKTTLIKLLCGLLQPSEGEILIDGEEPSPYTKSIVSYLPDRMYFADWMTASDLMDLFVDFYPDFVRAKAEAMCRELGIRSGDRIKTMSKGTKEKLQLVLVMSRNAQLYLLDEPIAGVDPAARDYILDTILSNYNESGTVLISTHLISDVEKVLDEVIFLKNGEIVLQDTVDRIRETEGKSVDALFRDIFKTAPYGARPMHKNPYGVETDGEEQA